MVKKLSVFFAELFFLFAPVFAELPVLHHDPWNLIIYRPENSYHINEIRCYLRLEDENGTDVTYTNASATYEWASIPDRVQNYQKKYYLSGGMAMHLTLKPGKYRISFSSQGSDYTGAGRYEKMEWTSNVFEYDTENPAKVLFVYPLSDDNGFYTGKWQIDFRAPKFYKFTKPKREN